MVNSRFTVAIHILCLLASFQEPQGAQPLTSEFIAGSVNTNPVVIRRLLATLRDVGLVRSQGGSAGGWELLKMPHEIDLRVIYRLVNPGSIFAMHNREPNPNCEIGRNIQKGLKHHFNRAQEAMEKELSHLSIADILSDVKSPSSRD